MVIAELQANDGNGNVVPFELADEAAAFGRYMPAVEGGGQVGGVKKLSYEIDLFRVQVG